MNETAESQFGEFFSEFFCKAAFISVFAKKAEGMVQLFFKIGLIGVVVGIEILFVNHDTQRVPVQKGVKTAQKFFTVIKIHDQIDGIEVELMPMQDFTFAQERGV